MNSSELNKFLSGDLSGKELQILIEQEVTNYAELMKMKGASISLNFYEDQEVFINIKSITRLLQETLTENLSNIHLAYICDCITLGEKVHFETEKINDIIFNIADPEVHGGYKSKADLEQTLAYLISG